MIPLDAINPQIKLWLWAFMLSFYGGLASTLINNNFKGRKLKSSLALIGTNAIVSTFAGLLGVLGGQALNMQANQIYLLSALAGYGGKSAIEKFQNKFMKGIER